MIGPRAKVPLLVVLALVLHTSVLSDVSVRGVRPDLMLVVALCAGLVGGPERGAVVGFLSGLGADLYLQTPLGLSALTFSVVAFGVGTIQTSILRAAFWITPVTAVVGSAAGVLLYAVTGAVVGQTHLLVPELGLIVAGVALLNAPLSVFAVRLVAWAMEPAAEVRA